MTTILNLGCGAKTHPDCINIDWSIHLRIARNRVLRALSGLLGKRRQAHIAALTANIVVHDLRRGIPCPDQSADAVYHSHVLEHIDRNLSDPSRDPALLFIRECRRVLKPGGVLRIVVPDLECACRNYLDHTDACERDASAIAGHDRLVFHILGQEVLREAPGSASQRPSQRLLENLLLGDARRRGQTHQWEYDRFNLEHLLRRAGFSDIRAADYRTSAIPGWSAYGLDVEGGAEYKPGSLYMEAVR